MPQEKLLPIGSIGKAHGIRGEVSVDYHADSPSLLKGPLFLRFPGREARPCTVASWRRDRGRILLKLEGCEDRTAAERLRGGELLVPEEVLPPLSEGEIYLHLLPGLSVIEVEEDGRERLLGVLDSVSNPAGQELWSIRPSGGAEEILFPAVPEFVLSFDLDAGEVRISPPPGLIDLYRGPGTDAH